MAFDLWAPTARTVRLVADGRIEQLSPTGGGWWASTSSDPSSVTDYGFLLDDDHDPLPDPRSRWQPDGVHGLSRTFDPGVHRWADGDWPGRSLPGTVIYELHLGTFTPAGTLDAAIERLDHLVELGIDLVELLPVNAFNGDRNWGYDGVLWFAVDDSYGGPAAYQRFVDACHRRGLGVVQDVVYNHLGPSGNYLPRYGPYLAEGSETGWGSTIDLEQPEVRRYVLDNAAMWFEEFHVDGLRLDAIHTLVDRGPTHLLAELAAETAILAERLGRPLSLIAESDLNDPVVINPPELGGYGIDAQWSDDFHHAVHVAVSGETSGYYADFEGLGALAKVLTRGFFHDGTYSSFRERNHGAPIDTARTPSWRLVVADQNHDQIGNRAVGDRFSQTLDHGSLSIAAVLTLTAPFTPMLFMGEEWGASTPWQFFSGHPEPELAIATAEGRIKEFERMGWDRDSVPDPQDPATFERSKLDWSEVHSGDHARLLALYRDLIALRRARPDLTDAAFDSVGCDYDDDAGWFVLRRSATTVAINFGPSSIDLPIAGEVLLATDDAVVAAAGRITLAPRSAAVLATDH